jgi:pimeloyl-ACP methyl ester carboxylesterase
MEQDIRFCKTSDGVRIAYAASGEGYPIVFVHGWASHLEFWPKMPRFEEFVFSKLAEHFRFIRYDARGWGLSDREVTDFSIESKIRDVEAVVENAGLHKFAILGVSEGGPTAITYASRHPERVSHLILEGTFAGRPASRTPEEQEELMAMLMTIKPGWGKDTPAFRQLWTARFMPEAGMEMIRWFNELQRQSGKAETVMAVIGAIGSIDVRDLLPQLQMPTLVVHARGDLAVPFEQGREIASMIPGARFLPLESNNHLMLPGEPANDVLAKAIIEFVGADPASEPSPAGSAFRTVLFTDLVDHTAMMQRLGDDKGRELLREHERITRETLKANGGTEVKTMGDGFMASFTSVQKAVECSIALQRAFDEHNHSANEKMSVRVGLNAGEPIEEDGDLFGSTVILASRIAAKAKGGEILVADTVRGLCSGKGFLFADRGGFVAKGFEEPVKVYEVSWAK